MEAIFFLTKKTIFVKKSNYEKVNFIFSNKL